MKLYKNTNLVIDDERVHNIENMVKLVDIPEFDQIFLR